MEISTIIPVYNGSRFIERAVNSVLQHDMVKEIILIDDGSTDNSLEICNKLASANEKIQVYFHPENENRGAGPTRNVGLKKAKFPYISFLDVDDIYLGNRFDKDEEIFREHPDAEGALNALGLQVIDESARAAFDKIKGIKAMTTFSDYVPPEEVPYVFYDIHPRVKGYFSVDGLTLKKSVLKKVGYFNDNIGMHEDTEWLLRLVLQAKLYCSQIKEATGLRGIHEGNRVYTQTDADTKAKLYAMTIKAIKDLNVDHLFKSRLQLLLPYKRMEYGKVTLKDLFKLAIATPRYLYFYLRYRMT